jgi:hypothetical protein
MVSGTLVGKQISLPGLAASIRQIENGLYFIFLLSGGGPSISWCLLHWKAGKNVMKYQIFSQIHFTQNLLCGTASMQHWLIFINLKQFNMYSECIY